MNNTSKEFNKQLELDVLVNGLTEITKDYVQQFDHYNLNEVIIPNGITSIGEEAFEDCTRLKNITIPDSVTSIGSWAFFRCYSLKNLAIPKRTNIGFNTFAGCNARIQRYVLCETMVVK